MRMLVLVQSAVACFIGYVFIGVASSVGIDVAMGVLAGFCGYSIFPNRDGTRWGTMADSADSSNSYAASAVKVQGAYDDGI